jgi:2-dehydro-3-deoxyglucarate aldolase
MADAGFEWLLIDLEHSVITIREAEELIRVIELKGLSPLVRPTSNDPDLIKRVMDSGAHGVVVPMVNSAQDASRAVKAVRYPPLGARGVGLARAQGYGAAFESYAQAINDRAVVIAQIEHVEGIRNLESILAVDGIDGTIIGPYDLSGSMGKPGRYEDEDVARVLEEYEAVSRRLNRPMGYHVIESDHEKALEKIDRGYTIIGFSADYLFLAGVCRREMRALRERLV